MGESIALTLEDVLARAEASLASDVEIAEWEREQASRTRHELLTLSGIGDALSQVGADAIVRDRPSETHCLRLVRSWLASRRPVLALFGGVGVGKTVAAAWALARTPGRYVRAHDLTRMRRGDFGQPDPDYWRHVRGELLVIDELGTEENAEHAGATLWDALDRRLRLPRRTLLLGNLDRQTLETRYDGRTLSRLREVAVLRAVRGADMRGAA